MAYFPPNSIIELMEDVPLTLGYSDTLQWDSVALQTSYFDTKVIPNYGRFTEQTYQRKERGYLRLEMPYYRVMHCNYMRYLNRYHGNKFFYAFVTKLEYINENTTEIQFEIDVLQTWWNEFNLAPCHVIRQHTDKDYVGYNIAPEPITIGEYIFADRLSVIPEYKELVNLSEPALIFGVNGGFLNNVKGAYIDKNYSALSIFGVKLNADNVNNIDSWLALKLFPGFDKDKIPLAFVAPAWCYGNSLGDTSPIEITNISPKREIIDCDTLNNTKTLDGYKPKNNKLYTYPFHFYSIDNGIDGSLTLRYEFFKNLKAQIEVVGNTSYPVGVTARPYNYKNTGDKGFNTNTLTVSNFPMATFGVDNFTAWLSQSAIPQMIVSTAITAGAMNIGWTGLASMTQLSSGASLLSGGYSAGTQADIIAGNIHNGTTQWATGKANIYGGRMSITAQDAKRIDDYFTRYGYALGQIVQKPKDMTRKIYMYIQTMNAHVIGKVPADDSKKIEDIFNTGITLWSDKRDVLNYLQENKPLKSEDFNPPY